MKDWACLTVTFVASAAEDDDPRAVGLGFTVLSLAWIGSARLNEIVRGDETAHYPLMIQQIGKDEAAKTIAAACIEFLI